MPSKKQRNIDRSEGQHIRKYPAISTFKPKPPMKTTKRRPK